MSEIFAETGPPHFNFPIQIIHQLTRNPELNLELLVALKLGVGGLNFQHHLPHHSR